MYDVVILGGGAAGLGAALYAARFSLNTACISKEFGGTGNIAHKVANWIGDPGVTGWDLMKKFIDHVKEYKVPLIEDTVKDIKKINNGFEIICGKKKYKSRTLIYSLGMKHRELGVSGEKDYIGRGVHYCYTCDGPFYGNKLVGVVGGGDSAALGSLMLRDHAKKVYVFYRGEKIRAEPFNTEAVYKDKKIKVIHKTNISEILGDGKKMTKVKLDNGKEMKLDGLFIEVGHDAINELSKRIGVNHDKKGFIKVDKTTSTNVEGFFAAGDITDATTLKQFITSASEGSLAAQTAYQYIKKNPQK